MHRSKPYLYRSTALARTKKGSGPLHRGEKSRANKLILPLCEIGQTWFRRLPKIKAGGGEGGDGREETAMGAIGAVFQPELINLMKAVLDETAATLPESKRTSTMMAEMASQILACAARGERNPATLKIAALLAVVERSHYSHDISPERRAV
jgi:hypothetical protein